MSQSIVGRQRELSSGYAAGRERAALVTLARGTLEVGGRRRQDFLHAMISNEVKSLDPGAGCRAASMTARGSLQALLRVLVDNSVVVLETEQASLEPLRRTLEFHKVGAPVRFALTDNAVLAVFGPNAGEVLERFAGLPLPEANEAHRALALGDSTGRLVRASDLPGPGYVLHVPAAALGTTASALQSEGAEPIGGEALDALRVESFCPWYGSDVTEDNLLHETGLLAALHSPSKGCYVGQEVIARLEGRGGHVNKALRGLRLSAPAAAGATIEVAGREAGYVTTAAVSPRLGPIALGYVHRNHFAPGTRVEVAGAPATVVASFEAGA
jgi:folate-binding protein YgfZ